MFVETKSTVSSSSFQAGVAGSAFHPESSPFSSQGVLDKTVHSFDFLGVGTANGREEWTGWGNWTLAN